MFTEVTIFKSLFNALSVDSRINECLACQLNSMFDINSQRRERVRDRHRSNSNELVQRAQWCMYLRGTEGTLQEWREAVSRRSNHSDLSPGSSESSPTHGNVIELAKTEGRDSVKCLAYTRTRAPPPPPSPLEKGKTSSPGRTKGRFVGSDVLPHQTKLLGVCPKEFTWATDRKRVLHG